VKSSVSGKMTDLHQAASLVPDGARDDATFRRYLDKYVTGVKDHAEYLEAVGGRTRLETLKASPSLGYSPDLKRRRLQPWPARLIL
jgi:hypothetical protein